MFKDFKNTPEEWVKVFKDQQEHLALCFVTGTAISKAETFMRVIDFDTYVSGVDAELAPRFCAALKSILDRTTFEFIKESRQNYLDFLTLCNLSRFKDLMEWGTSIRGAWFSLGLEPIEMGRWLPVSDPGDSLKFDEEEKFEVFIRGLIMFMEEPEESTIKEINHEFR